MAGNGAQKGIERCQSFIGTPRVCQKHRQIDGIDRLAWIKCGGGLEMHQRRIHIAQMALGEASNVMRVGVVGMTIEIGRDQKIGASGVAGFKEPQPLLQKGRKRLQRCGRLYIRRHGRITGWRRHGAP